MFAYLSGTLQKKLPDCMIIEVGGVGYKVHTAVTALYHSCEIGSQVKVYTHLNVREDNISLYGFLSEEELKMFEQLITVSGVGPKAALALVSNIPAAQFGLAVLTDDSERFTKAPGIGKKTAQRIILELKDKLKKESKGNPALKGSDLLPQEQTGENSSFSEAVSALAMLGYSASEANQAVSIIFSTEKTIEELVRDALKNML